jgi:hypothetical protein
VNFLDSDRPRWAFNLALKFLAFLQATNRVLRRRRNAIRKWGGLPPLPEEGKKIAREELPASHEPNDDGFDAYRLAVCMECLEHDGPMIGEVDDNGDLHIRPFGPQS